MIEKLIDNSMVRFGGLHPTTDDARDFPLGAIFDLPDPATLPEEFELEDFPPQSQGMTGFCSGYGTAGMSSLQEGKMLHGPFAYAAGQVLYPLEWGQNSREAMKAHVKIGCIALADAPDMTPESHEEGFLRNIKNYPADSLTKAKEARKQSFFEVTGPYDAFDNIRSAIYKFRDKKRAASCGVMWKWRGGDYTLRGADMTGSGHFMYYKGWRVVNGVPYLVVRNSGGENVGYKGDHLIPREEVNFYVKVFKSYMFVDISPEDAKTYLIYGISPESNAIFNTLYVARVEIIALFARLLGFFQAVLLFNKINEGMPATKTLVEALIEVESGGNDSAIGDKWMKNPAYGCLQIRQPACDDVNRVYGTNYKAQDMLGRRANSLDVFEKYMSIWATEKRIGRPVTDEDRARMWNGGPSGFKKISTLVYWSKVSKALRA